MSYKIGAHCLLRVSDHPGLWQHGLWQLQQAQDAGTPPDVGQPARLPLCHHEQGVSTLNSQQQCHACGVIVAVLGPRGGAGCRPLPS